MPAARAAAAAAADAEATDSICRTPREDDLNLNLGVRIEGKGRRRGTLQSDCLAERPAMAELARVLGELAERICAVDE